MKLSKSLPRFSSLLRLLWADKRLDISSNAKSSCCEASTHEAPQPHHESGECSRAAAGTTGPFILRDWSQAEAKATRAIEELAGGRDFDPEIMKRSARIFIFPNPREHVQDVNARWREQGYRLRYVRRLARDSRRERLELVRL